MKETMQEVLDALRRKEIGKEEAFAKIKAIKDQNTLESGRQKKPDLFKREFTYNEPYLQAHIIFGKQVLLGVTNVSIAIEALKERISSLETMHLHRIVFQKPLVMEAGKASITVRVKEGKEKYVFENYVKKNSDVEFLSISGEVVKGNVPVVEQFDYENFVANGATPISESKIENNPMLKRTKVLNAVHEVYSKDDIAAGILTLSDDIINATEPYMVHPAILDSGFIVGGASLSEELISPLEGEGMWIPFMIKDIYVLGEIPRRSICKTQFLRATDDLLVLSFSVFNEDGELLLLVNELTFKFTARNVAIGDKKKVAFDLLESIKEYLTESIAQELQEDKKQIWRNRNFMEMGIESNSLIHLSSQLEEELGVELYPTIFFEYQTIDELSNYLESSFQQPLAVFFSRVDKEELFDDAEQVIEAETATEGFMEQEEKVSETQNETNSENNSVMDQELDRIAVIGMSLKFPMSDTPEEFWENLKNSKDMITEIPKDHWDVEQWFDEDPAVPNKTYSKWGSFIEPDKFDPVFFGITPREAEWMDPQLRILLEKVQDCIDDAGYGKRIHGTNTGLFLATTFHEYWDEIMRDNTPITDYQAVNSVAAALAGRVSYLYDLQGISIPIDNACASSLTALHLAKNSLLSGECDMALVAGVNLLLSPVHYIFTSKAKALSPTGHCYAFDEKANGYVPGEGVAVLLLKSLKKAKEDGDQIHAVIRGTAVNHVGRANNPTSPRPELQIKMLKEAWKDAKVRPEQISYIEAHGTGTKLGDPIEFNSLRTAFGDLNGKRNFCSLGSVKAHIGHLEAAAGLAGVIRTILSMKNKQIPAMPHFEHVNPLIDIENSPFYINQSLVNWETELGTPRRAGVSSFGMAGHNAHVVLEEYVKEEKTITRQDSYLFILSAKNEERLQEYASLFIRYFEQRRQKNASDDILSSATYTLQVGREEMEYRLAIIANSERDLYQKLSGYCMGNEEENDVYYERVAQMKLDREQTLTEEVMLALEEKNMQLLAKKWVSGSYIEWCELYKDGKPDIVSLPSYPFARERYWKKNPDRIENTSMPTAREVLHPLIDSNISTFDSQQYYKFFTKEDFCIEEHQVAGKRVLPGVAYLEMARITAELSQKNAVVESISNMVWVKTAVLSDEHLPVYVELYPEGANATVVFKGEDEEQYAQGKVKYRDSQSTIIQPVRILDKILERCGQLKHGEDFYSQYRELGLIYGPSYCVMKKIWSCDGEAIAYLQLSDERKQGMSQYVLHPAMMDGALQVITGIPSKDQAKQLYLPFSIGKLTIYEKVSSACYVHAKTAKDYGSNKTFTIEILDENGNVLIAIEDFLMRAAWLDSQDEVQEYYLYQKGAKPAEQDVFDDGNKAGKIVAFVTNSVTREELLKHFEDVVIINRGEGYQKKSPYEFVVNQSCEEEYKRVFHELPWKPSAVVYLWADAGEEAVNNVEFQILNSFYSVFYCIRQYISMENVSDMHFLYAYARAKELPCNGAVEAFLKSVHFENVKFKWKMVGLDDLRSGEIEESLKKEYIGLIHQDGQHIFYQQKVRYQTALLQAKDKEESGQGIVLRKNGTYILAGGKGKLGTNLANYLRAKEDIQLVILGRGQQDEWMKDASGIEFIPTDLSNEDEVASAIAHIKVNHKEINGVFQCAGACQDAYMKDKDVAACERVLGAKVKGTFYLDKYTKEEPIDYFVVYSSLAGITGNIGQCDYAYANNFLNELGSYREQNNHPGKTMIVNWPYWKDGGMTISKASEQMMMKTLGLKPITNEIGMELLEASMDVDGNNCLPLIGDYQKFKQVLFEEDRKVDCGKTDGVRENVQHKQGFPEDKKLESLIRDGVIADVSSILRVNEKDIDVYAEMNEFGFDSITFTEFGNLLNEKYGTNIIPSVFFEHTTLLSFIQYLQEDYKKEFQKYYQLDLADVKNQQDIEQAKNNEQSKEMPDVSAMRTCRVRKEKSVRFDVQDKAVSANRTVVNNSDDNEEIAIIGMSGIMPDSDNMDEFWDNLIAGRDMVSEIPADRWDYHKYYGDPITERNKTNVKYAGFMRNVDKFDPAFFGISPLEAELMDPQQRIFLETTWNTILDAGYNPEDLSDSYTGVFVGVGGLDYLELIRESETDIQAQSSTGISHCLVPNRVSFFFNFHGPSEPVNTACSSSLVAIHNAVRSIQRGECEQAIAGGVNVIASPSTFISFSKAGMLASDGKCKTFDKDANGYVRGEGSGAVMLKKLSKAKEDGDHIYAVVKGSAINHGGRAASLTAPNTKAQAELIVKAWKDAKVDPSTVTYIEAHGTGTSLGDPVEVNGLKKAFSILYQEAGKKIEPHTCGIGSVKSNIGHLETAAGIASVMKVVLAMQHKKIPKTIHFKEQNPYIDFTESPFYVVSAPEEWTCQRDEEGLEIPRRAGISSFGFGGVNSHLVLEEYREADNTALQETSQPVLIPLSARTKEQLRESVRRLIAYIENRQLTKISKEGCKDALQLKIKECVAAILNVEKDTVQTEDTLEELGFGQVEVVKLVQQMNRIIKSEITDTQLTIDDSIDTIVELLVKVVDKEELAVYQTELKAESESEEKSFDLNLVNIAFTLQCGRSAMAERVVFIVKSVKELVDSLNKYLDEDNQPKNCFSGNIKKNKEFCELLGDGEESESFVKYIIEHRNFEKLAKLWALGLDVKWSVLYDSERVQRVSLPGYPFLEQRCWIGNQLVEPQEDCFYTDSSELANEAELSEENLQEKAESILCKLIGKELKIPSNVIEKDTEFCELGLDSINVNQLNGKMKELFPDIPATVYFTYKSVDALAEYLVSQYHEELKFLHEGEYAVVTKNNQSQKCAEKIESPQETVVSKVSKESSKMICERTECNATSKETNMDIAIIGLSGRYPMGDNLDVFWDNLWNGQDGIEEIPMERWDYHKYESDSGKAKSGMYCKWGGFLHDIDKFDSQFFHISPTESKFIDPQERLFIEASWSCVEEAGYTTETLKKKYDKEECCPVGVFAGVTFNNYQLYAVDGSGNKQLPVNSQIFSVANRVSYLMNFSGPSLSVDTACSSSLYAVHLACESIRRGECEAALAGGVNLSLHPSKYITLCEGKFLASDGRCHTFGDGGDGYVPGEGVGVIMLKPLAKAKEDNDHIYGVIKGSAVNHDGKTYGFSVPNPVAQTRVIKCALEQAKVHPETISYVEAHGTGTSLGDPIEIQGLTEAYRNYTDKKGFCAIGSVKSNIGHLEAAAGISQITKVLLQMKEHRIAPTLLHSDHTNPNINFEDTPFYVAKDGQEWNPVVQTEQGEVAIPRRAGVSSFGVGGVNVHVILEEYIEEEKPERMQEDESAEEEIIISANTQEALTRYARQMVRYLKNKEELSFADIAYTLRYGRKRMAYQIFFTASDMKECMQKLEQYLDDGSFMSEVDKALTEIPSTEEKNQYKKVSLPTYPFEEESYWIVDRDVQEVYDALTSSVAVDEEEDPTERDMISILKNALPDERYPLIVEDVRKLTAKVLEFEPPKLPNVKTGFFDMGLDSILSAKLYTLIEKNYGLELYSTTVFDYPNVEQLATYLQEQLNKATDMQEVVEADGKYDTIYYTTEWVDAPVVKTQQAATSKRVLCIAGNQKEGTRFASVVAENGCECVNVVLGDAYRKEADTYQIRAGVEADYEQMVNEIISLYELPSQIVYIADEIKDDVMENDPQKSVDNAFYVLLWLTKAMYKTGVKNTVHLLYTYSFEKDKIQPLYEGTAAFAKSMLYENPNIICKTLGLEKVDSMNKADQIWTELIEEEFTCSNIQITSDGRKEKKNREIIEQSPDSVSIKEGGVYLITGGTGGLGKIFSKYLATRTAVTLILTGRKALDARIEEQMKQLKEFGARAVYVPCDASSMEDVRKLYRFCKEKFGQVNGIIHAAGVLKDSYIIKKTREEVEQVLAPKILGIRNLDIAFQKEELDFFLSFSSLAAVDGCAGQCDYAYANYYMEGYTCYRKELCKQGKRFGCSKVINWPVWKHGGMGVDKEQEETMKRRIGLLLLDTQEGMKAFEKAMSSTCSQFGVVRANRSKLARLMEILPYQNCEESKLEIDIPDEILNKDMSEVIGELELLLEELE